MRILAPLITGTVLSAGGAAVISLRNPAPAQFAPPSWSSQRYHEIAHSSYGLEVLGYEGYKQAREERDSSVIMREWGELHAMEQADWEAAGRRAAASAAS